MVDDIASCYGDMAFVSFGDSVLLKSNYTVGSVDNKLLYTYAPESTVLVARELVDGIEKVLGLPAYAIFAQGYNEYYNDDLLQVSRSQNHVSLNSLGIPFAHLLAIDSSARRAIRNRTHGPAQIYMDSAFYHSLRFKAEFRKNREPNAEYVSPMSARQTSYFYNDFETVISNLRNCTSLCAIDLKPRAFGL